MPRRRKNEAADVLPIHGHRSDGTAGPAPRVGWLVRWSAEEGPVVDFVGNPAGPVPARSVVALDEAQANKAVAEHRGAVLLFEDDRPDLPIIMGLLAPSMPVHGEIAALPTDVKVDGKRVEIEGADEIVLRCGQASIVLRRNGRVVIRGTAVETRARGVNRIKGGSVLIN